MNREELISLLDEVREEIRIFERPSVDNSKKMLELLTEVVVAHSLPPAEGAEKSCLSCRFHNSPTYHDKMWCRDCQQLSHYEQQPTAEGAEEMDARTYLDEWMRQHNYRSNKLIGWSEAVDFADDFATLHAQRIADKMVSERMEQYKAQFKDRPNPLEVNPYDSKGIKRIRNRKIH